MSPDQDTRFKCQTLHFDWLFIHLEPKYSEKKRDRFLKSSGGHILSLEQLIMNGDHYEIPKSLSVGDDYIDKRV